MKPKEQEENLFSILTKALDHLTEEGRPERLEDRIESDETVIGAVKMRADASPLADITDRDSDEGTAREFESCVAPGETRKLRKLLAKANAEARRGRAPGEELVAVYRFHWDLKLLTISLRPDDGRPGIWRKAVSAM